MENTQRVPRLVPGVDVRVLPLAPIDGFVLSRIDGTASIDELAEVTGLAAEETRNIVLRLIDLGAAEWSEVSTPRAARAPKVSIPRMPLQTPARGIVRTAPPPPGTTRALYDPAELEEDIELDIDRKRAILDSYYRLEDMTFYELLSVPQSAEKKEIRSAYFDLSKQFHPDTLFRKRLGSYKAKMEAVFNRLTEAYEVLSKKNSRAEYDAYVTIRNSTMATQQALQEAEMEAEAIEKYAQAVAEGAVVQPASVPRRIVEEVMAAGEAPAPVAEPAPPPPAAVRQPPEPPATQSRPTDEGRRRAQELLARKLASATGKKWAPGQPVGPQYTGPGAGAGTLPEPPPAPVAPAPMERDQLLRGLAASLKQVASITGGGDKAARHIADARKAETEGNLLAAANSMRLAIALAGERPDLATEYERIKSALGASLAESYQKQAAYEMRNQKWAAAAISWSKVVDGRPDDPAASRHTAECLLRAAGDLHKAQRYARRAVDLAPNDVHNRRALAEVYVAAGLRLNAKRELDAAAKLDPADEIVKNLLRELKD